MCTTTLTYTAWEEPPISPSDVHDHAAADSAALKRHSTCAHQKNMACYRAGLSNKIQELRMRECKCVETATITTIPHPRPLPNCNHKQSQTATAIKTTITSRPEPTNNPVITNGNMFCRAADVRPMAHNATSPYCHEGPHLRQRLLHGNRLHLSAHHGQRLPP